MGLDGKLRQAKETAEKNKFDSLAQERGTENTEVIKNNYSLMVISNKEKLQSEVEKFYPNLRKSQASKVNLNNYKALIDGINDGQKIEINRGIGNRRQECLV